MVAFSGRPLFYQISVLLLLLATLAFCLALALPWWTQTYSKASSSISSHSGLWLYCSLPATESKENCHLIKAPGWLKVVQGMQGVGLVGMTAASVYALVINFCIQRVVTLKALEMLTGTGSALGIVSATVYITKTSPILEHNQATTYSWALSINLAASILAVFLTVVFVLSNRRPPYIDEATKIIVQDCGGHTEGKDTGSRSPEKGRAGRGAVEMERSPVRTRRLEAISETFVSLEEDEEEEEENVDESSRQSVR